MNNPNKRITGFHAYDVAIEIVHAVEPLLPRVHKRNARLGRQLVEALSSIPMNVAEGWRRLGRDREYHYTVAAGSAAEVLAGLEVAQGLRFLEVGKATEAIALLDRELAMLYKLTHK